MNRNESANIYISTETGEGTESFAHERIPKQLLYCVIQDRQSNEQILKRTSNGFSQNTLTLEKTSLTYAW